MTRIAVLGNSHAASIRAGWDLMREEFPDIEVVFFSAPQPSFSIFSLNQDLSFGVLDRAAFDRKQLSLIERLNGAVEIELSRFDHVVKVGQGYRSSAVLETLSNADVEGTRQTDAPHLLSSHCFDTLLQTLAQADLPGPSWRDWQGPDLLVVNRPRVCELIFQESKAFGPLQEHPEGVSASLDRLEQLTLAQAEDAGFGYLAQPATTLDEIGLTRNEFSRGIKSPRKKGNDYRHMNADFGRLQLNSIFERLGAV